MRYCARRPSAGFAILPVAAALARRLHVTQVSVLIPTFRRPEGFLRAARSVLAQQNAPGVELIAVDNSPEGSARAAFRPARSRSAHPVSLGARTPPGVAHARNAALLWREAIWSLGSTTTKKRRRIGWPALYACAATRARKACSARCAHAAPRDPHAGFFEKPLFAQRTRTERTNRARPRHRQFAAAARHVRSDPVRPARQSRPAARTTSCSHPGPKPARNLPGPPTRCHRALGPRAHTPASRPQARLRLRPRPLRNRMVAAPIRNAGAAHGRWRRSGAGMRARGGYSRSGLAAARLGFGGSRHAGRGQSALVLQATLLRRDARQTRRLIVPLKRSASDVRSPLRAPWRRHRPAP